MNLSFFIIAWWVFGVFAQYAGYEALSGEHDGPIKFALFVLYWMLYTAGSKAWHWDRSLQDTGSP